MWGCLFWAILLPIFQQVKDCTSSICHDGYLEDSLLAFQQMGEHNELIICAICIIFSIGSFNALGVAVTKYASSAQRSTIDTSRTVLIWIVSLGVGWETFIFGQLIGFLILSLGTLVYNEILIIPISIFKENTRIELAKKKQALDTEP